MPSLFYYICYMVLIINTELKVSADDAIQQRQRRNFVLAGIKEHRDLLKKGIFRIRGSVTNSEKARGVGEISIYCAFDNEQKKMRFDRREPAFYSFPDKGVIQKLGVGGGKSVSTPEYVINAPLGHEGKYRGVWIEKPEASINASIRPFDIRAIGLDLTSSWQKGDSFETIYGYIFNGTSDMEDHVSEQGNGIVRLDRICQIQNHSGVYVQHTLWVDSKNGFTPKRFESRTKRNPGTNKWSDPTQYTEVTWRQINNAWVPVTAKIVEGKSPANVNTLEFAIEWESVNRPVDDKLFTEAGLELKPGSFTMLDYRFGDPILLKQEGQIGPAKAKLIIMRNPQPWTAYWPYAIAILFALILIGANYWWYRRWKHAQLLKIS